jgi:O-acetyl-ADP-ribose deacetylase (regulator of RNase III)
MEVLFLNTSLFSIPSSHRVGAIVHDGASDLRLWPGPGPDRTLLDAYGPGLRDALETELDQLGVEELALGDCARVHPGRLHCDFLAWIATRAPEPGAERSKAPDAALLEKSVQRVLEFVSARNVARIAFAAVGAGPGELPPEDRLAVVVRAARAYEDDCFATGRRQVVEQVLVCEPIPRILALAKKKVATLARSAEPARIEAPPDPPKRERAPRAASSGTGRARRVAQPRLDAAELAVMRARSAPYDRTQTYAQGDWVTHPKFGVGRVELVHPDKKIDLLFEDGSTKTLIHGRA